MAKRSRLEAVVERSGVATFSWRLSILAGIGIDRIAFFQIRLYRWIEWILKRHPFFIPSGDVLREDYMDDGPYAEAN